MKDIYQIVKDSLIDQGVVFFGGYAATLYGKYMPISERKILEKNADFDVLSDDPETSAIIVKERLEQAGFSKVKLEMKSGIGEIIAPHWEIIIDKETVAFIYEPIACHSYNTLKVGKNIIKVATDRYNVKFLSGFLICR